MRVLVVHAHPTADSYSTALREAAVRGLRYGGHEVRVRDLYAESFDPVLTAADHDAYHSTDPLPDPVVARHAADALWADALVFVYPTWWSGPPAILKGWFDRVLVPGVGFVIERTNGGHRVRAGLPQLRLIAGITTYGAPRWLVWLQGDGGRRTLLRALWSTSAGRPKRVWLGLSGVDGSAPADREAFAAKVEQRMARL
ncbi:MAG TPA: NAD(P)H-dependent oxidoreductase [Acidimicrobiales bacterium]